MHQQRHRTQPQVPPPCNSSCPHQETLPASTAPSLAALQQAVTSRHWPWPQVRQHSSQAWLGQQQAVCRQQYLATSAVSAQVQLLVTSQPQQQHLRLAPAVGTRGSSKLQAADSASHRRSSRLAGVASKAAAGAAAGVAAGMGSTEDMQQEWLMLWRLNGRQSRSQSSSRGRGRSSAIWPGWDWPA
jgi:hypothetical protein